MWSGAKPDLPEENANEATAPSVRLRDDTGHFRADNTQENFRFLTWLLAPSARNSGLQRHHQPPTGWRDQSPRRPERFHNNAAPLSHAHVACTQAKKSSPSLGEMLRIASWSRRRKSTHCSPSCSKNCRRVTKAGASRGGGGVRSTSIPADEDLQHIHVNLACAEKTCLPNVGG